MTRLIIFSLYFFFIPRVHAANNIYTANKSDKISSITSTKYNFLFKTGTFYQQTQFAKESRKVKTQQNILLEASYKEENFRTTQTLHFHTTTTVGLYTQDQIEFERSENITAELLPSGYISTGIEIENRQKGFSITPLYTYESFSTIISNNNQFSTTNQNISWLGFQSHYGNELSKKIKLFAGPYAFWSDRFSAQKTGITITGHYKHRYEIQTYFEQKRMRIQGEMGNTQTTGMKVGYRF